DSVEARIAAGLDLIITSRVRHMSKTDEVLLDICKKEDKDVAGQFAMLVWSLWNNRNNKVWNGEHEGGRQLGMKAHQLWHDWKLAQNIQQQGAYSDEQQQHLTQWQQPPIGWYKCNADAGFHSDSNKTSAGWILRDHTGQFVTAGTSWNQGKCSIIEGEAIALLEAIK
ncbi:BZIP-like protein, partial [Trifolium medium]|nr:BZIP-like protein [Trifolium medium]